MGFVGCSLGRWTCTEELQVGRSRVLLAYTWYKVKAGGGCLYSYDGLFVGVAFADQESAGG